MREQWLGGHRDRYITSHSAKAPQEVRMREEQHRQKRERDRACRMTGTPGMKAQRQVKIRSLAQQKSRCAPVHQGETAGEEVRASHPTEFLECRQPSQELNKACEAA